MYKHLLIPLDGSECSQKALTEGIQLAKELAAEITFLHAVEDPNTSLYMTPAAAAYVPEIYASSKAVGEKILAEARALAEAQGIKVSTELAERKNPIEAILEAEGNADFIVIGTHGRRGFNRAVFGSVAEGVIRQSETPSLVIRVDKE